MDDDFDEPKSVKNKDSVVIDIEHIPDEIIQSDKKLKGQDWNTNLENETRNIGESSICYKIIHSNKARKTYNIYLFLMILGIIIGPISGVVSAIDTALNPPTNPTMSIIAIFLSFLSGIVVSIVKFGRYDELSNSHQKAGAQYTSIENNIRRQLSLYRKDRVPANSYLEFISVKYDDLFLNSPLVSEAEFDKFIIKAKKNNIAVPIKHNSAISVNTESEIQKNEDKSPTNSFPDKMLDYELSRLQNNIY